MFDVVVVGAGVAGSIAARECREAGLDVHLLEARDRVGGRLSAIDAAPGVALEVGGEFYRPWATPVLAAELERYGIATGPAYVCEQQLVVDGDGLHDLAAEFAADPGALRSLVETVRREARRMSDPDAARELDAERIDEALEALTLPPRIKIWFRCWIEQYAGTSLSNISVANMLKLVKGSGGSLRSAAPVSGRHLLPDTRTFTERLAASVIADTTFGVAVTRIERRADGTGFEVHANERTWTARSVIVAVPRNVLAAGDIELDLDWAGEAPAALREAQPGLGYKMWARLDSSAPIRTAVLGELGGFRLLCTTERQPDGSTWAVLFGSAATLGDRADDLDREVRSAVASTWGASVEVLEVRGHDWVADPFARGAWTTAPVQDEDPIADLLGRLPAGLAFAGADFSSERGGVESALKSGMSAAAHVRTTVEDPERTR